MLWLMRQILNSTTMIRTTSINNDTTRTVHLSMYLLKRPYSFGTMGVVKHDNSRDDYNIDNENYKT